MAYPTLKMKKRPLGTEDSSKTWSPLLFGSYKPLLGCITNGASFTLLPDGDIAKEGLLLRSSTDDG